MILSYKLIWLKGCLLHSCRCCNHSVVSSSKTSGRVTLIGDFVTRFGKHLLSHRVAPNKPKDSSQVPCSTFKRIWNPLGVSLLHINKSAWYPKDTWSSEMVFTQNATHQNINYFCEIQWLLISFQHFSSWYFRLPPTTCTMRLIWSVVCFYVLGTCPNQWIRYYLA